MNYSPEIKQMISEASAEKLLEKPKFKDFIQEVCTSNMVVNYKPKYEKVANQKGIFDFGQIS